MSKQDCVVAALVAATVSLLTARFVAGEVHRLAALRPSLVALAGDLLC